MSTPREELFRAWAATDPQALLFPTVSFAFCLAVFVAALCVVLMSGSRAAYAELARLPLEDEAGGSR